MTRKERDVESSMKGARKPYQPPRLEKFGSITKLTGGMNGSRADHGQGQKTKKGQG